MTWQLGDQQHHRRRDKHTVDAAGRVGGERALARAKEALLAAEFVGFYETLDDDFWTLWRDSPIFSNVRHLSQLLPFAFWVGTLAGRPRLRVRKYTDQLSAADRDALQLHNDLDVRLFDWARARFRPTLKVRKGAGIHTESIPHSSTLLTTPVRHSC